MFNNQILMLMEKRMCLVVNGKEVSPEEYDEFYHTWMAKNEDFREFYSQYKRDGVLYIDFQLQSEEYISQCCKDLLKSTFGDGNTK